jgi:hypothetical protein
MKITAYAVNSGGAGAYCAVFGSEAGAYVPSGTKIFSDPIFRNQIATASGSDYVFSGQSGVSWEQPIMAANQPDLGGALWGLSTPTMDNAWRLSDGFDGGGWASGHSVRPYPITYYNPTPLVVTQVGIKNSTSDHVINWDFRGTNDYAGDAWETLASGTNTNYGANAIWYFDVLNSAPYRYLQFRIVTGTDGDWENLNEVRMFGTQNIVDPPVVTNVSERDKRNFNFITKEEGMPPKYYMPTIGNVYAYNHRAGEFTKFEGKRSGYWPITQGEYDLIQAQLAAGDTLRWYSTHRPYTTTQWTQPTFTSATAPDGSVISASGYQSAKYPYYAMNGDKTSTTQYWSTNNSTTGSWQVIFPYKIAIYKLVHVNRYDDASAEITGRYYADTAMTTTIGAAFTLTGSLAESTRLNVAVTSTSKVVTNCIFFNKTGGNAYSGIEELEVSAEKITYEVLL